MAEADLGPVFAGGKNPHLGDFAIKANLARRRRVPTRATGVPQSPAAGIAAASSRERPPAASRRRAPSGAREPCAACALNPIARLGTATKPQPLRPNDSPQPIADLRRPAHRVNDLARNPIPPNQVATSRLCGEGAIVGRHGDNLGAFDAKPLTDELRGSHLHQSCRDRESVLGVILRAEESTPVLSYCGYRLNGGQLVRGQNLRGAYNGCPGDAAGRPQQITKSLTGCRTPRARPAKRLASRRQSIGSASGPR